MLQVKHSSWVVRYLLDKRSVFQFPSSYPLVISAWDVGASGNLHSRGSRKKWAFGHRFLSWGCSHLWKDLWTYYVEAHVQITHSLLFLDFLVSTSSCCLTWYHLHSNWSYVLPWVICVSQIQSLAWVIHRKSPNLRIIFPQEPPPSAASANICLSLWSQ